MCALIEHTADWNHPQTRFGPWITVHSIVMVLSSATFGSAVARTHVLPCRTGITLLAGMALMTAAIGLPDAARTVAAGVRDLAFAAMGDSLLLRPVRQSDIDARAPTQLVIVAGIRAEPMAAS